MTRLAVSSGFLCLLALSACAVTHEDLDTWMGTVRGPGKILAVLLADKYADDLRVHAALNLVRMERPDVEGVNELLGALESLDEATRTRIVDGMTTDLLAEMRGEGQPQPAEGQPPPARQIRAKDAAFRVLRWASAAQRAQLTDGVVGWFVVDFTVRSLSGSVSAEQAIRELGAPAATQLVAAMNARINPGSLQTLVKIGELVATLGDPPTKARAAERIVQIEREIESQEWGNWVATNMRAQITAANERARQEAQAAGQPPPAPAAIDETRVAEGVAVNRATYLTQGVLPAMHHLAGEVVVSNRLLEMAQTATTPEDLRVTALQAMEGHVRPDQVPALLALALAADTPPRVRDYAFDRIADSRSRDAIPQLWPLATSPESENAAWRRRWRVSSLILTLGGPEIVQEWFNRIPTGAGVQFAREELHGYADRLSAMRPTPTELVRQQLASADWWDKAIALYYFERVGTESDLPRIQALARDTTATVGEHWEQHNTIGAIVPDVIAAIRERMQAPAAGGATGAAAPAPAPAGG